MDFLLVLIELFSPQSMYGPLDRGIPICGYNLAAGSFHTKKLCSRLSTEVEFYWQNSKIAFCATLGGTYGPWVTYTVYLWLIGKRVMDFLY